MERLGVGGTIRLAFGAIWSQRRHLAPIVLIMLIAETAFMGGYRYFGNQLRAEFAELLVPMFPSVPAWDWSYLLHALVTVPHNLYGAVFVVLVMRVFLFGLPLGAHEIRSTLGRSIIAIFLFKYLISTYHTAWRWMTFPQAGDVPFPIIWAVFWSIGVAITARFCLLYATASMGRGWQLRRCWRDAAGNGLRLFLMFLVINIPVLAIGKILENLVLASVPDARSGAGLAMLALLSAAKRVVASTILLALIAAAFARLTDFAAAGVPGAGRTSQQLAEAFE